MHLKNNRSILWCAVWLGFVIALGSTQQVMQQSSYLDFFKVSYDGVQCGVHKEDGSGMRPFKIMMTSSHNYLPVMLNWLIFYHQICPSRQSIYLICLDADTEAAMQKIGMRCSYRYGHRSKTKFNNLWVMRTRMTNELLAQGFDVLMCDSDALWLRNPWPYIQRNLVNNSVDIVSSRANFPTDVSDRMGACLCFGFMYVKSSRMSKAFWAYLSDFMGRIVVPDDQRTTNRVLMTNFMRYMKRPRYVGYDDTDYGIVELGTSISKMGAQPLGKRTNFLRVALLGHESFRRVCEGQPLRSISGSVVVHCVSDKSESGKLDTADQLGMWLVLQDWEQVLHLNDSTTGFLGTDLRSLSVVADPMRVQAVLAARNSIGGTGSTDNNSSADMKPSVWNPGNGHTVFLASATATGNDGASKSKKDNAFRRNKKIYEDGTWQGREKTHLDGKKRVAGGGKTKPKKGMGRGGSSRAGGRGSRSRKSRRRMRE